MRLYIIRHADPDYANDTITCAGHQEAQARASRLASEGLTHIYCSPLNRARHTMQYTADLLGIESVNQDWMQEIADSHVPAPDNRYQAPTMAVWDIHGETIRSADPLPTHDTWRTLPALQGKAIIGKFETIKRNSDAFLAGLGYERQGGKYRRIKPNKYRVAVFTHNGLGLTWLAHMLEIPLTLCWAAFWLPPSSVTTVLFDERSDEWATPRCIGLGDVSHLYEAGLPVQPRGIIANFD